MYNVTDPRQRGQHAMEGAVGAYGRRTPDIPAPKKTGMGYGTNAAGGAMTGASLGTSLASGTSMGASTGGWIGAIFGAAFGAASYYRS